MRILFIDRGSAYVDALVRTIQGSPLVETIERSDEAPTESQDGVAPDVVFIDSVERSTGRYGDDTFARIRELFPLAHVFIITDDTAVAERPANLTPAVAVIRAGADIADVVAAMRNAASGAILVQSEDVPSLLRELGCPPVSEAPPRALLSPRESEVLSLLAHGMHAATIARTLGLSIHTVRSHVKSILAKLESHSQLQAVAKALEEGLLDGER